MYSIIKLHKREPFRFPYPSQPFPMVSELRFSLEAPLRVHLPPFNIIKAPLTQSLEKRQPASMLRLQAP